MENSEAISENQKNSIIEKSRRFLFGDDIFISYSRVNSTYALSLANELTKKKLSCFLDQWGTPPGEELPKELLDTIKRCSTMVLIGSKHAAESENVGKEVKEFLETGRPIIPITFVDETLLKNTSENFDPQNLAGTLEQAEWYPMIAGIAKTTEVLSALKARKPSENVISRIFNAVEFRSRSKRLRKTFYATLGTISLLVLIGVFAIYELSGQVKAAQKKADDAANTATAKEEEANKAAMRAEFESNRAKQQEEIANLKTREADDATEEAKKQTEIANKQSRIADEKNKLAQEKTLIAERAAKLADEQTRIAELAEERKVKAENEAQKQESIAYSSQLAIESKFSSDKTTETLYLDSYDPQRAVLLAIESLKTLKTPKGIQALQDAIMNLTDQAYSVDIDEERGDLSISSDAKFLGIIQDDKSFIRTVNKIRYDEFNTIDKEQEKFSDRQIPEPGIMELLFSRDGKKIASITESLIVTRNVETFGDMQSFPLSGESREKELKSYYSSPIMQMENFPQSYRSADSQNGDWTAKINEVKSIEIVNSKTGKIISASHKIDDEPGLMALSNNGNLIAVEDEISHIVKVYKTEDWKKVAELPHEWNLREMKFSSDGKWLTTITGRASIDDAELGETVLVGSTIRVWDLSNNQLVMNTSLAKEGGILRYKFVNDDRVLIVITPGYSDNLNDETINKNNSHKNKASVLFLNPDDLISLGCSIIARNLSNSEWANHIQDKYAKQRQTCEGLPIR